MLKISNNTIEHIADGIVDLIISNRGKIYHKNSGGGGQSGKIDNELFWESYIKRVDPHEKRYIEIVNKDLNKLSGEVFTKIEVYPDDTDKWKFDKKKWIGEFAEIEATFLVKLYKQEGQKAIDEALKLARKKKSIKAEIPISIAFDLFNPLVKEELLKQTTRFPAGLINTTEEIIRGTIATGLEAGESIDKLADRVMERLGSEANKSRAETIARSETIYGSNAGAEMGYMQSGVVEGKQWLTSIDERSCIECELMNNRTASLGESFNIRDIDLNFDYTDGEMPVPPLHCNCRCTIIPLIIKV
jgi:SPP1 gp7 family putative phage head morphogenesis protein